MIDPWQRPLPDNSQYLQEIDTYSLGRFRTRNPSKWTAAVPRHRQR